MRETERENKNQTKTIENKCLICSVRIIFNEAIGVLGGHCLLVVYQRMVFDYVAPEYKILLLFGTHFQCLKFLKLVVLHCSWASFSLINGEQHSSAFCLVKTNPI